MSRGSRLPGLTAGATLWLAVPVAAWACGSMGLNDPRVGGTIMAAIFLPMLVLMPVEMAFLRVAGGIERFFVAYLACLPAKAVGLFVVATAAQAKVINGVVAAELTYSAAHFLTACLVLGVAFRLRWKELLLASALISTLIPWLYSLGLWLIARTVL
jgi:hypothetical protein